MTNQLQQHDLLKNTDVPIGDRVRLYVGPTNMHYIEVVSKGDYLEVRCAEGRLSIWPHVANVATVHMEADYPPKKKRSG